MTDEAKAAAENIEKRLCHLSDEIKNLYDAISRIDCEAYDISYDAIHLCNMLETDDEKEPNE
jgi:hypothetical protein